MKKRLPIICAAAALAAFLALMLFVSLDRPRSTENEHFGLVEEVYSLSGILPTENLEGDTDVVTINGVLLGEDYAVRIDVSTSLVLSVDMTVRMDGGVAMTSKQYEPGKLKRSPPRNPYDLGQIERLENGEWVIVSDLEILYKEDTPIPMFDEGHQTLTFAFPLHQPGEYRISYNFRSVGGHPYSSDNPLYTGAEQYTVSHTVTVPEASDKPFDLLAADVAPNINFAEGRGYPVSVDLLLRSNDGEIPYNRSYGARLEKLVDGRWVDISDDAASSFRGSNSNSRLLWYPFKISRSAAKECWQIGTDFWVDDRDALYRVFFDLRAERGSLTAERYPLVVCFDFSE